MSERPFSLTVDLDYLYISDQHRRVYEETLSAVRRRDGLICIIGDPGTGKTLLCKRLLEELNGDYKVVLVNTPPKNPCDVIQTLDAAFGGLEGDHKIPLAVFDEAQHLDFRCLDHIKFLTNLEKDAESLLQIILVGQPELAEKLRHRRFHQLEQRISAKLKVGPLKKKEVSSYLAHRLTVAGLSGEIHFTKLSAWYLYGKTWGVPRLINRIANLAVELAVQREQGRIGIKHVKQSFSKVSTTRDGWIAPKKPVSLIVPLASLIFFLALSAVTFLYKHPKWGLSLNEESMGVSESLPLTSHFIVKAGTFLARDQAENLRAQLGNQGFPSTIVARELGDGWTLYQVRLLDRYSTDEADNVVDLLRTIGIKSAEVIEINP